MKRTRMLIIVAIVQTIYAASAAAIAGYTLWLARALSASKQPNAANTAHGMVLGSELVGAGAVVYAVAAFGFWRARAWAWWLAVVSNALLVIAVLYDSMTGDRDPDNWIAMGMFAIPMLAAFLPGVRSAMRRQGKQI